MSAQTQTSLTTCRRRSARPAACLLAVLLLGGTAGAQVTSTPQPPVYLDDSPAAVDLLNEAGRLTEQDRLVEASELCQRLIDEFGDKLMAVSDNRHTDAARQVASVLMAQPKLLKSYRERWEPEARRLLTTAMERQRQTGDAGGDLELVRRRFGLTAAGLDAALTLAGLSLERGVGADAEVLLDSVSSHPDLSGADRTRWLLLQGAAALLVRDEARLVAIDAALKSLDDPVTLARWQAWRQSLTPTPAARTDIDEARTSPAQWLPLLTGKPLWTMEWTTVDTGAEPAGRGQPSGVPFPCLPVALDGLVVVNDGQSISALDALSGRRLWRYTPADLTPASALGQFAAVSQWMTDQRSLSSDGRSAYAVLGRVSNWRFGWRLNLHRTWLTALDLRTGEVRWQVEPSALDESLGTAFFHGTPVEADGRVYVLVRRNQMSGFHGAFVVAVHGADGRLLWKRHLSSAAVGRGFGGGALGQMTLAGGRLYVSDNLGAVTCLDSRSGQVQWLAVMRGDEDDPGEMQQRASLRGLTATNEAAPPLLIEAGLLVPSSTSRRPGLVLDPATGLTRRELPADIGPADRFYRVGDDVLRVGRQVQRLDGRTLEARWSFAVNPAPDQIGEPAILPGCVIFAPGPAALVMLDLETGKRLATAPVRGGGHVLVASRQLLVAGGDQLSSFMSWPDAQTMLRARIARNPLDVRPCLALAFLGHRHSDAATMLEGVDAALLALRRPGRSKQADDGAQTEVFRQVRQLVDDNELPARQAVTPYEQADAPDSATRRELLDRLAAAAATPADEVVCQLAMGRFRESTGQPQRAIEHYQNVLEDPALASQLFPYQGGSRQARLEATLRLKALVGSFPRLYEPYEAAAGRELAQLLRNPQADPDALVGLAERYPLASSAAAARVEAGRRLLESGRSEDAIAHLRRAYPLAPDDLTRGLIVGQIALTYERMGHPGSARRWLTLLQRQHPAAVPIRDGQIRSVRQWLEDLASAPQQAIRLPVLELPLSAPLAVRGAPMIPRAGSRTEWPHDRVLLRLEDRVQLRQGADLAVAWETPLAAGKVFLLSLTAEQVLLWHEDQGVLMALDGRSGRREWPDQKAEQLLAAAGDPAHRGRLRPAPQQAFIQMMNPGVRIQARRLQVIRNEPEPGYLLSANDAVVMIADHAGRVLALDRRTGQVLWQRIMTMDRLDHLTMDEESLALAGQVGSAETISGWITVLDPLTGEPRVHELEDRNPVQWLGLGGDGLLIYSSGQRLTAHRIANGEIAWRLPLSGTPIVSTGLVGRQSMLTQDQDGTLLVVDLASGRIVGRLPAPAALLGTQPDLQTAYESWYVLTSWQACALDPQGRVIWRDGLAIDQKNLVTMLVGENHVVLVGETQDDANVNAAAAEAPVAAEPAPADGEIPVRGPGQADQPRPQLHRYQVYVLERLSGRLMESHLLGPLSRPLDPAASLLLDGRVVLGAAGAAVIIRDSR